MDKLKNYQFTIYDAQIIIYYCFLYKTYRIMELTKKARLLTQFLINHGTKIVVPESVIYELKKKGIGNIVSQYTSTMHPSQVTGLKNKPTYTFEYRLEKKVKENFNKMLNREWFEVRRYSPCETTLKSIGDFFENIEDEEKLKEFLTKKGRKNPVPSRTDMELISFSKEIKSPLISNDKDIVFFADELLERKLSYKIFNFMELDFYSN